VILARYGKEGTISRGSPLIHHLIAKGRKQMADGNEVSPDTAKLLSALSSLARNIPTVEELLRVLGQLEDAHRAEGRKDPERREFWEQWSIGLEKLLIWHWQHAHKSPTACLQADGGAVAESGELATGRV